MRRRPLPMLLVLTAAAGCLASARPARAAAAAGTVEVQARIGWDGQVVRGRTAPAEVDLTNRGASDVSGAVEVVNYSALLPPPPPGSPPGTRPSGPASYLPNSAYGEPITLPGGSTRHVVLFFPLNSSDRLVVRFRSGSQILGSTQVDLGEPDTLLRFPPVGIGVLAGGVPPGLEQAQLTHPDGSSDAPLPLRLSAALLPPSANEMDAFSALVVDGADGGQLSATQRQAVADWVKAGGRLILAGGAAATADLTVLPAGDRPFSDVAVATRSDWSSLAGWLGTAPPERQAAPAAAWRPAGQPLGPAQGPIAWRAPLGSGDVVALAVDPERDPWRSGPAAAALWRNLLAPAPAPTPSPVYLLTQQTRSLPSSAAPGWQPVALYLVLFAALAGPLTYLALRWRRRSEWLWLVVPLLALAFAGGEFGWMKRTGRDVVANAARVVQSGEDGSRTYTAVGYFAPGHGAFTARLQGISGAVQVTEGQPQGGSKGSRTPDPDATPPYAVSRVGNDVRVDFAAAAHWGMNTVAFEQPAPAPGLNATLRLTPGGITADVRNGSTAPLDHVTLIVGHGYRTLATLAPGESASLQAPITAGAQSPSPATPPGGPTPLGLLLFLQPHPAGSATFLPTPPLANPLGVTVRDRRRADLLDGWQQVLAPRMPGPLAADIAPTLVAWSGDEAASAGPWTGLPSPPHLLTMYVLNPLLQLPPGPFTLPAGLSEPEVLASNGGFGFNGTGRISLQPGGTLVLAFRPPLPATAEVDSVDVDFPSYTSPTAPRVAAPPGQLDAYDFASDTWRGLSGMERFRLDAGEVGPGGEVRLRITGVDSRWFALPTLSFTGVVR